MVSGFRNHLTNHIKVEVLNLFFCSSTRFYNGCVLQNDVLGKVSHVTARVQEARNVKEKIWGKNQGLG